MTQPPIPQDVMEVAAVIERDIPSRITGADRVFIRASIARAIMEAKEEEREECAQLVEKLDDADSAFPFMAAAIRNRKLANNTNKD